MKFAKILMLTAIALFCSGLQPVMAQIPASSYRDTHQYLLANVKTGFNKEFLQEHLRDFIGSRESNDSVPGLLSAESEMMIGDLLNEALGHYGKRYRRGGKGPSVFDCSGFTSYVYYQFGYSLSPSSKGQYLQGVEVPRNELYPGDLVFFSSPRSRSSVGHVGIVVTADNETGIFTFIHASVNRGIRIETSNSAYYSKRYIGARRIIIN